jgi:hypothetical protein
VRGSLSAVEGNRRRAARTIVRSLASRDPDVARLTFFVVMVKVNVMVIE